MIEDKIKVIDEIIKRHPSFGVKNGWSYYTGGMADTGDWYFRKMLDEPMERLQTFLNNLISEENKPKGQSDTYEDQLKKQKDFFEQIERRLMFGK